MRSRQSQAWWLAILFAVGNSCCASLSYQDKACNWLEVEPADGLEVTAMRVAVAPWSECTSVKAPGYYRLRRDEYTVELWNGDRGDFPQLYLRVLDGNGTHLAVESRQLSGEPNAHLRGRAPAGKDYDYFLFERLRVYKPGERLDFAVLDPQGRELRRESLAIVSKAGGKYRDYH